MLGDTNLVVCMAGTLMATLCSVLSFNRLPTAWIFDYGQEKISLSGNLSLFSRKKRISALLFTLTYFFIILSICIERSFLIWLILFILSHIGISDLLNEVIPDQHIVAIGMCGIMLSVFSQEEYMTENLTKSVVGGLIGFALYFIPFMIEYILRKIEVVGFGDIKLFAALGLVIGGEKVIILFILTNIFSFFVSINMLICEYLNNCKISKISGKCCKFQSYTTLPLAPIINILFIFCI